MPEAVAGGHLAPPYPPPFFFFFFFFLGVDHHRPTGPGRLPPRFCRLAPMRTTSGRSWSSRLRSSISVHSVHMDQKPLVLASINPVNAPINECSLYMDHPNLHRSDRATLFGGPSHPLSPHTTEVINAPLTGMSGYGILRAHTRRTNMTITIAAVLGFLGGVILTAFVTCVWLYKSMMP